MDDLLTVFHREWPVIEQAPWSAGAIAITCIAIGWGAGRFLGGERIRILLSRIDHRDDEIKRLNAKIAEFPNSSEKKKVRAGLAQFLAENEELEGECLRVDPPPTEKLNEWGRRLTAFVDENLDASYKTRLKSDSGFTATSIVGNYSDEQERAALWLHHRAIRLNEFLSELSR